MKIKPFILQMIASTVLLTSFSNVFAEDTICPPSDMIKNTLFKSAYKIPGNNNDTWTLVSDSFNYKDNQFNVIFTLEVDTRFPSIALKKGQTFFNQANLYSKPYQTNPDPSTGVTYIFCKYWEEDYYVEASNPPYPYPIWQGLKN